MLADGAQRFVEQRDRLVVDGDDRHAEPAEAERGAGEQFGVIALAGEGGRGRERVARVLAGPQPRLAERQQEAKVTFEPSARSQNAAA